MIKKAVLLMTVCCTILLITACQSSDQMQDGYYTAQAEEFSHGWKEYITISVKNDKIIAVEYNAENASGFIKSWDNAYMKNMKDIQGTYPNEYTRNYASQLLALQNPEGVDGISGASNSGNSFKILASAVMEQAKKGDSSIITVKTE